MTAFGSSPPYVPVPAGIAAGGGSSPRQVNLQTGTAYTLALSDNGAFIKLTNAAPITLTVPADATVAFPIGATVEGMQGGAGLVTIAAAGGVSIAALPGLNLAAQSGTWGLVKLAANSWVAYGRLTP